MSLTGPDPEAPTKVGVPIGDVLAGMYGAFGVVSALVDRARTGRGEVVRTSLLAAIVGVHAFQGTRYTVAGEVGRAEGNHHVAIAPYGLFRCADGAIQMTAANDGLWRKVAAVLDLHADDPRFATNTARVANRSELTELIEKALAADTAENWTARFEAAGVPCGRVRTLDEVYADPQTFSQGLLVDVEHDTLGSIRLPGPPLRLDRTARTRHAAPPRLGQHDHSVRTWLERSATQE